MILKVNNIYKSFFQPESPPLNILKGISFEMNQGDTLAISGQSGSGKTTLLSILAGLDYPDSGSVILDREDLNKLNEDQLAKFRAAKIGIIFQQFHLMPHLTAEENISLPLEILKSKNIEERTNEVLKQVGLEKRKNHLPGRLSGGECQRVAIARALAVKPAILLADELTGNLDNRTGRQVMELLFDLVHSTNMTLVMVSHNLELAARCKRQLQLVDGKLR